MSNKKIIVWSTDVFRLIEGKPIGGIAVQMYFWAQVFAENGWRVFSFAEDARQTITRERIEFKPVRNIQRINFLLEWWRSFKYLLTLRPEMVIYRGANRHLLPLSIFARFFGVKLVYFAASDVNFVPGKELVGSEFNRKLYHRSIRHIHHFVTQNQFQHDTLLQNYGKESLIMYNIWGHTLSDCQELFMPSDVVWVANFRRLKRAEWVFNAAVQLPNSHFVMAGGPEDKSYYEEMKNQAQGINNVNFLGPKSFFETNLLVKNSKVLLCTSTFEGFPNTFLQAWSNGLPVISTVDPSGIIRDNNLGVVVENEEELYQALQKVLNNKEYYDELNRSVTAFFAANHSSESGYEKLMSYISHE